MGCVLTDRRHQHERLRQKLKDDSKHPRFIKTIWGSGYMFIGKRILKVEWLRRPFGSLFSKLLLIMFVSGILIVSTVSFVSWLMHIEQGRNVFRRNMNQYVSYLVKDLGSRRTGFRQKNSAKNFLSISITKARDFMENIRNPSIFGAV